SFSSFIFVTLCSSFCEFPIFPIFFPISFFSLFFFFSIPFIFSHFPITWFLFFQIFFVSCSIVFFFFSFKILVHHFGTIPCIIHAQLIFIFSSSIACRISSCLSFFFFVAKLLSI